MNRPGHDDWADQSIGRASHQQTGLFMKNTPVVTGPEHIFLDGDLIPVYTETNVAFVNRIGAT